MTETAIARRIRERKEREAAAAAAAAPQNSSEYNDLVPDAEAGYARSEQELTIDRLIDGLDILKAYDRFIGKKRPPHRVGQREGVKISCPQPNHPDRDPSAWINLDKQTWYCGGCGEGGDKLDLAALYFGMGDYKEGKRFGELRTKIAEALGYRVMPVPGGDDLVVPVTTEPPPTAEPSTESSAPVLSIVPDEEDDDLTRTVEQELPGLDWRPLVPEGTFLDKYMKQCTVDDLPEEFHFWNGLLCVSMSVGRDVTLRDLEPVLGNFFLCVIGRTGSGKSRAGRYATRLIKKALPYDSGDPLDKGVKAVVVPSSGESFIGAFEKKIYDPSNPKIVLGYAPVRGLIDINELSALMGRSGRAGNTLKPVLMQFFDGDPHITTGSVTNGEKIAEDAYACVVTSVQPKALPALVGQTDADSGFLNRWIFASGTPKRRVAIGGAPVDIEPCVTPLTEIHEWAMYGRELTWSREAFAAFNRFHDRVYDFVYDNDSGLTDRLELFAKKLCLLFACNERRDEITEDIVTRVEFICDYLIKIFGIQESILGNTEERMCEEQILKTIRRNQAKTQYKTSGVPLHVITDNTKKFPRKLVSEALVRLAALHEIESYVPPPSKTGRKPKPHYRLLSEGTQ